MAFWRKVKLALTRTGALDERFGGGFAYLEQDVPIDVLNSCQHGRLVRATDVAIRGGMITVLMAPVCSECLRVWLESTSTLCATCNLPIVEGMSVAEATIHSEFGHPFTHFSGGCAEKSHSCGVWSHGRVLRVH
jgi:hypothetical protein